VNCNQDIINPLEAEQFGQSAAALLCQGSQSLPAGVKDRLYAARLKALSVKKPEKALVHQHILAASSGSWSSGSHSFWNNVGWVAPLVVLVFGLIGISQWQQDSRINDIAELDVALLTDDVPPDAYADNGFIGFLKNGPLADAEQDGLDASESPS
jgi:hypothetical protein